MRTILVVDNESEICDLLKSTFEERDEYRVHAFESGAAALAFLSRLLPDLALIDVLLPPPISGDELARRASALDVPV
ncbi:MAG: response regulator, partial [Stellaceae bacterium]